MNNDVIRMLKIEPPFIFRYLAPWRCASQLQCIVAVAIADVLNNKKVAPFLFFPGNCYFLEIKEKISLSSFLRHHDVIIISL